MGILSKLKDLISPHRDLDYHLGTPREKALAKISEERWLGSFIERYDGLIKRLSDEDITFGELRKSLHDLRIVDQGLEKRLSDFFEKLMEILCKKLNECERQFEVIHRNLEKNQQELYESTNNEEIIKRYKEVNADYQRQLRDLKASGILMVAKGAVIIDTAKTIEDLRGKINIQLDLIRAKMEPFERIEDSERRCAYSRQVVKRLGFFANVMIDNELSQLNGNNAVLTQHGIEVKGKALVQKYRELFAAAPIVDDGTKAPGDSKTDIDNLLAVIPTIENEVRNRMQVIAQLSGQRVSEAVDRISEDQLIEAISKIQEMIQSYFKKKNRFLLNE